MGHFALQSKVKENGFEGWYIRFTDLSHVRNIAVIMAHTTDTHDPHAFIQIFDGQARTNTYIRFAADQFSFQNNTVHIGANWLSETAIHIATDVLQLAATLTAQTFNQAKSAMGFLERFPLETFQEVVIMRADYEGTLTLNGVTQSVSGRTYMEKTYGHKFPKTWFWLQANHFRDKDLSFSMSGGHVPTVKIRPFGFFALLYTGKKNYRFATYNLARMARVETADTVQFIIRKWRLKCHVTVKKTPPTTLVGPADNGQMNLEVYETLDARVTVTLTHKGSVIFTDESPYAGFEYMMKG